MATSSKTQILFAGNGSYRRPEPQTDRAFLTHLITEVENVIETNTRALKAIDDSRLEIKLDMDEDDPKLMFSICYKDYDVYPPSDFVKETGLKLQEKICEFLKNSYNANPTFYFSISRNWSNIYSFYFHIRPNRGTFECPICGEKLEDSDDNFFAGETPDDEGVVVCCSSKDHCTFFMEDCLSQKLKTRPDLNISDELGLYVADENRKEHLRLAFQLNIIAKNEYSTFRPYNLANNTKIYILAERGVPVGYVCWNDFSKYNTKRCLRKLFIKEDYRRRGLGTLLVEKTVEIETRGEEFLVESPNNKSHKILLNLGLTKIEGDKLIGVKCVFVGGV